MSKLDGVPDVDIDGKGRFKYILIKVTDGTNNKLIVRGYKAAGFHGDILDTVESGLMPLDLLCDCLGGGRIEHDPDKKKISVYGYSQGFGRADHEKSVEILKKKFTDYDDITWSNDGY